MTRWQQLERSYPMSSIVREKAQLEAKSDSDG